MKAFKVSEGEGALNALHIHSFFRHRKVGIQIGPIRFPSVNIHLFLPAKRKGIEDVGKSMPKSFSHSSEKFEFHHVDKTTGAVFWDRQIGGHAIMRRLELDGVHLGL